MNNELIFITDTFDGKISENIDDLFGVSALLKKHTSRFNIFLSSSDEVHLKVPEHLKEMDAVCFLNGDFKYPAPGLFCEVLIDELKDKKISCICLPHSMRGCAMAAKLSDSLDGSLITGVDRIIEEDGILKFRRNLMGGKWISDVFIKNYPLVITISKGAFPGAEEDMIPIRMEKKKIRTEKDYPVTVGIEQTFTDDDNSVEDADFVVGAGMGAADEDLVELLKEFAGKLKNAAVGSSRPLCDSGLMPYSRQVGETGKQISPKLYIACGISGSNQHIAGIKKSGKIIALNKDPEAPIFRNADIGIVARIEDFIPEVLEKI